MFWDVLALAAARTSVQAHVKAKKMAAKAARSAPVNSCARNAKFKGQTCSPPNISHMSCGIGLRFYPKAPRLQGEIRPLRSYCCSRRDPKQRRASRPSPIVQLQNIEPATKNILLLWWWGWEGRWGGVGGGISSLQEPLPECINEHSRVTVSSRMSLNE